MSNEGIQPQAALILKPGDVLVVGISREHVSTQDLQRYRTHLMECVPGLADVIVLAGCTALAAYRPEYPHCPTCRSPDPRWHHLLMTEGLCPDAFHNVPTDVCNICRDSGCGGNHTSESEGYRAPYIVNDGSGSYGPEDGA